MAPLPKAAAPYSSANGAEFRPYNRLAIRPLSTAHCRRAFRPVKAAAPKAADFKKVRRDIVVHKLFSVWFFALSVFTDRHPPVLNGHNITLTEDVTAPFSLLGHRIFAGCPYAEGVPFFWRQKQSLSEPLERKPLHLLWRLPAAPVCRHLHTD